MGWITNLAPRQPLTSKAQPRTDARAWYEIRNAADADEAEVLLYDEIGGWMGLWADEFVDELAGISAPRIALRLNSPGGSVFEGVAVANALRAHPANVTVYVDGIAASIASIIALAGDRLVMRPQSQLMIHDASSLTMGNAADMREMADLLDKQSDNLADAYAEKAGGDRARWRAAMQAETWYSAQEAVDAGLADEVQSFRKQPQLPTPTGEGEPAARWDLSVFRYAGRDAAPAPQASAAPDPDPGADQEPQTTHLVLKLGEHLDDETRTLLRRITDPQDALGGDPVTVPTDPPDEVVHAPGPQPGQDPPPMGVGVATEDVPTDTAAPTHHTATVDGSWDGPANEKRLPSPMPPATAKKVYGWYDSGQTEDGKLPKSACKMPHHEVTADGTPGAANLAGVRNALSRLPQSDIPEAERGAVEKHLRAHLDDADTGDHAGDDWAAMTAHLTTAPADDWAQHVAHLTSDTVPSSSAATA